MADENTNKLENESCIIHIETDVELIETGVKNNRADNVEHSTRPFQGLLRAGADRHNSDHKFVFELEDRGPFIRKTLALVALGLFITSMAVIVTIFVKPLEDWLHTYALPILIADLFVYLICAYIIMCYPQAMVGYCGVIVYCTVVLCMTVMTMLSCVYVNPMLILMAACFTCLGVLIAIIVASSRIDLTKYMGIIMVIGMVVTLFLIAGSLIVLFTEIKIIHTVIVGITIILILIYIMIDLQLIFGGKHHQLTTDMYFFGATLLYVDIVLLFLYILRFIRDVN